MASAFLLDLARAQRLAEGDGLELDTGSYIRVLSAAEPVVEIAADSPGDLLRIAWHLGNRHLPLLKARMGDACKRYTIDKGLAGGAPGAAAPFVALCHIYCDSLDSFQAGFGPHAAEIMADIPNYTDVTPVVQISEVVLD